MKTETEQLISLIEVTFVNKPHMTVSVCVCVCFVYVYAWHMNEILIEFSRGYQLLRGWSYRWFLATRD